MAMAMDQKVIEWTSRMDARCEDIASLEDNAVRALRQRHSGGRSFPFHSLPITTGALVSPCSNCTRT